MTPVDKEVQSVNDQYARAAAAYSAQIVAEALQIWESVNRFSPAGRALMLAKLSTLILAARVVMARMAVNRAQLVQALRVGSQLGGGNKGSTLQDLRDAYSDSLAEVGVGRPLRAVALDKSKVIPIRSENGSLAGVAEEVNDGIDKEIETTIQVLGDGRLGKIAKKEGIVTPKDVATSRDLVAAGSSRIALNGARHTDAKVAEINRKVLGYVRVHNDHAADEPCSFCAMMLSRGPVYRSEKTAQGLTEYHLRCHCTAQAVYSMAEWTTSPVYTRNRMYEALWAENIQGKFSGDGASSEWRALLKSLRDGEQGAALAAA